MTETTFRHGVRLLHAGLGDPDRTQDVPRPLLPRTDPLSPEDCAGSPFAAPAFPLASDMDDTPVERVLSTPDGDLACLEYAVATPLPGPVYLCGRTTSSMDVARFLAASELFPVWGSVLALGQRQGRGQFGRNWVSPEGNLFATLRLPLVPPFDSTAAAPAIGGLIAEALADFGFDTAMKWPNDLLQPRPQAPGWCKVGGILLEERRGGPFGEGVLLAGVGLNLIASPPESLMRAERAVPAGCLCRPENGSAKPHTEAQSAFALWMRLVRRLFFCYVEEIATKEQDAWRSLAERRLAFLGQSVLLADGPEDRERHRGILVGLDACGGLRLQLREGTTSFLSGSLQLNDVPMQP